MTQLISAGELASGEAHPVSVIATNNSPRWTRDGHLPAPLVHGDESDGTCLDVIESKVRCWNEITQDVDLADFACRSSISRKSQSLQNLASQLRRENEALQAEVEDQTRHHNCLWRGSRDVLLVIDSEGFVLSANPAATAILGWSQRDLIGSSILRFIHAEDKSSAEIGDQDLPASWQPPAISRCLHADGGFRWVSWAFVSGDDRVYACGYDLTAERQQADALHQAQKMESVGQLTGGLAHDFNNLLTGISGSLDLLRASLRQGRITDASRYGEAAQDVCCRAATLTHRLLAFSRRQTIDPKPTDVDRLIDGMSDLIRQALGPGIEFRLVDGRGTSIALVDSNLLENALLNVCINARDAMPEGGSVTIEVTNHTIDAQADAATDLASGRYIKLSVHDTGTGMAADIVDRACTPFFTTKAPGLGTGLGLSMVRGFAEQSGGQVQILSHLGRGTTVTILLPQHHRAPSATDVGT